MQFVQRSPLTVTAAVVVSILRLRSMAAISIDRGGPLDRRCSQEGSAVEIADSVAPRMFGLLPATPRSRLTPEGKSALGMWLKRATTGDGSHWRRDSSCHCGHLHIDFIACPLGAG